MSTAQQKEPSNAILLWIEGGHDTAKSIPQMEREAEHHHHHSGSRGAGTKKAQAATAYA